MVSLSFTLDPTWVSTTTVMVSLSFTLDPTWVSTTTWSSMCLIFSLPTKSSNCSSVPASRSTDSNPTIFPSTSPTTSTSPLAPSTISSFHSLRFLPSLSVGTLAIPTRLSSNQTSTTKQLSNILDTDCLLNILPSTPATRTCSTLSRTLPCSALPPHRLTDREE